jgi:hypothetical protein
MLREIQAWRRLLQIKLWVLRKGRKYRNSLVPYFEGKSGIEIGGPSLILKKRGTLPLYNVIECLDGCNYSEYTQWSNISKGNNYNFSRNRGYQYISEATNLKIISDKKYQFLLTSHCLEHIANPIKALKKNGLG